MARILVVEDEPDILLLHRYVLEAEGHEVILAADGAIALERIENRQPDAVVLDLDMPVLDGWGVLERLQQMDSRPPVLLVTAYARTREEMQRAEALGVVGRLQKPHNVTELTGAVAALLKPAPAP